MKKLALVMSLIVVSACTQVVENSQRAVYKARGVAYETTERVQKWLVYDPPSDVPQAPQTRYCYKAMGDIVCYREPQPFLSNPLIGRQGTPDYEYSNFTAPVETVTVQADPSVMPAPTAAMPESKDIEFENAKQEEDFKRRPVSLMPRY